MTSTPFSAPAVSAALGTPIDGIEVLDRFAASQAEVARLRLSTPPGGTVIAKHATGAGAAAARREIRFFEQLAPQWAHPAPQLLGATDTGADVLLLTEDLGSAGYCVLGGEVSDAQLHGTIDVLAGLHAHFWNDVPEYLYGASDLEPSVTSTAQAWPPELIRRNAAAVRREARLFFATATGLEGRECAVLEEVLDAWPRQFEARVASGRAITLIHGDFHFLGNIFFTADDARPKVIDWSELKPGLGPHDLAYCLTAVPAADRLARDRELLRYYWETLRTAGVDDYTWDLCYWDFRFSAISNLFQSVFQRSVKWYRASLAAMDALDCYATLTEGQRPGLTKPVS